MGFRLRAEGVGREGQGRRGEGEEPLETTAEQSTRRKWRLLGVSEMVTRTVTLGGLQITLRGGNGVDAVSGVGMGSKVWSASGAEGVGTAGGGGVTLWVLRIIRPNPFWLSDCIHFFQKLTLVKYF